MLKSGKGQFLDGCFFFFSFLSRVGLGNAIPMMLLHRNHLLIGAMLHTQYGVHTTQNFSFTTMLECEPRSEKK